MAVSSAFGKQILGFHISSANWIKWLLLSIASSQTAHTFQLRMLAHQHAGIANVSKSCLSGLLLCIFVSSLEQDSPVGRIS